jgi:hypothetical protein
MIGRLGVETLSLMVIGQFQNHALTNKQLISRFLFVVTHF